MQKRTGHFSGKKHTSSLRNFFVPMCRWKGMPQFLTAESSTFLFPFNKNKKKHYEKQWASFAYGQREHRRLRGASVDALKQGIRSKRGSVANRGISPVDDTRKTHPLFFFLIQSQISTDSSRSSVLRVGSVAEPAWRSVQSASAAVSETCTRTDQLLEAVHRQRVGAAAQPDPPLRKVDGLLQPLGKVGKTTAQLLLLLLLLLLLRAERRHCTQRSGKYTVTNVARRAF